MWNIVSVVESKVIFVCKKCGKTSTSMKKCNHCGHKKLEEQPYVEQELQESKEA